MVGKEVTDIAWSFDNQRIVAVGDGKEEYEKQQKQTQKTQKMRIFSWNFLQGKLIF